jgi:serine/threonine protein kinase
MPYMPNGHLKRRLQLQHTGKASREWTPTVKSKMVFGIVAAMVYMNHKEIMHRDLNPENIFLDRNLEPVLSNFGTWKGVTDYDGDLAVDALFLAPEIHTSPPPYDFRANVYSFGIVFYLLASSDEVPVFDDGALAENSHQITIHIGRGARYRKPADILPFQWDLIQQCWAHDVESRPLFQDIIARFKDGHEYAFPGTDMDALLEYEERLTAFQPRPRSSLSSLSPPRS